MPDLIDIQLVTRRAFQTGGSTTLPALVCPDMDDVAALRSALRGLTSTYVALLVTERDMVVSEQTLLYMLDTLDGEVSLVYADYVEGRRMVHTPEPERHICRDTFDFGPIVLCRAADARDVLGELPECTCGALYGLTLGLQRRGRVERAPLPVGIVGDDNDTGDGAERQFDYVRRSAAERQAQLERLFTQHLRLLGALQGDTARRDTTNPDETSASVIIPVKDRARTIADAVHSALQQRTNCPLNVIVVDNHSTDGTGQALDALADERLVVVRPEREGLGIGGCWNLAVADRRCGKWAVQLDSDDLYSSPDAVQTLVDKLEATGAVLAVGSYRLVDMQLNDLPPGLIDHREWTDENGRNNILRVNGMGAPRAWSRDWLRQHPMPDVSYGEDYAAVLRATRDARVERVYDCLYLCRRWGGNSDAHLTPDAEAAHNAYKDKLRSDELEARRTAHDTRQ